MDEAAEPQWLEDDEQQAWIAIATLLFQLPGTLDRQLQRDSGLTLFEYFTLSGLSMAPDRTMRMSDLALFTNGSLSRLSNVAKRLEQRGWIERHPDPDDGRFTNAVLTDAGWDVVVAAAPGHVAAVRRHVIAPLTPAQLRALATVAPRIAATLDSDDRC
ncbi:MarR family winged helix-turn-helix transcriptional regulator [Jatrophihabitans sp. YIM 134969]